jgi:hypothetical protein
MESVISVLPKQKIWVSFSKYHQPCLSRDRNNIQPIKTRVKPMGEG